MFLFKARGSHEIRSSSTGQLTDIVRWHCAGIVYEHGISRDMAFLSPTSPRILVLYDEVTVVWWWDHRDGIDAK